MINRFFEIIDDLESGRWYLRGPETPGGVSVNPELFRIARRIDIDERLKIRLRREGVPVDWTFADLEMPVLSLDAVKILDGIADSSVQLFPVEVIGSPEPHFIANILECVSCIDETRSEVMKWTEADNRPDKIGQYRQVNRLVIKRNVVAGLDVFRVDGWKIAIIVSERLKKRFEERRITGITFEPV